MLPYNCHSRRSLRSKSDMHTAGVVDGVVDLYREPGLAEVADLPATGRAQRAASRGSVAREKSSART